MQSKAHIKDLCSDHAEKMASARPLPSRPLTKEPNAMKITRAQVFAKAEALGVEISVEKDWNGRHFHAYAPTGKIFSGSLARASVHHSSLGDAMVGETPDWASMFSEIETEDCPYGIDCDCCRPD